MSAIIMRILC